MEDQAQGGGEGGWEIMPECPTATFFSNGSRLNLARYVAYIFFFCQGNADKMDGELLHVWRSERQKLPLPRRRGGVHTAMPPIWNVSSSWQGILSFSYVE